MALPHPSTTKHAGVPRVRRPSLLCSSPGGLHLFVGFCCVPVNLGKYLKGAIKNVNINIKHKLCLIRSAHRPQTPSYSRMGVITNLKYTKVSKRDAVLHLSLSTSPGVISVSTEHR